MSKPATLRGSSVLVVGGSSGIGLASAQAASRQGAAVCIASRNSDRLQDAAAGLGEAARWFTIDLRSEDDVAAKLAHAGPFDHVVVTPGSVAPNPVRGGNMDKARAGFDLKFWGAYRIAAHANISSGGSLTLVSGVYAIRPVTGQVIGSCVNAAVESLAKALALEFAPVRVNAVSPGLVDTPLWHGLGEEQRKTMFAAAAAALPSKRIGAPDDIADLILAVMSNPMINGTVIIADGGHVLV